MKNIEDRLFKRKWTSIVKSGDGYCFGFLDYEDRDTISYEEFLKITNINSKYKKIERPDIDPYGEEDWGWDIQEKMNSNMLNFKDFIYEAIKKSMRLVNLITGKEILWSINQIVFPNNEINRDKLIEIINKNVLGKKVMFYNYRDGKNTKKDRICEGAYWRKEADGSWQFMLIGSKKDYVVNMDRRVGYYIEYTPSKNMELDPYGEEDWGDD